MARVSIEERGAAGAKKLARSMGWSKAEAIGKLYFFWHDSQELEQSYCSLEDLSIWMELSKDDEPKIVQALINAGFLEEAGHQFHICGNEKHIESLTSKRKNAKENGKQGGRPPNNPITDIGLQIETNVGFQPITNVGFQNKPTLVSEHNQSDNLLCSALHSSALLCEEEREGDKKTSLSLPIKISKDLENAFIRLWQAHATGLRPFQSLGAPRMKLIRARLQEKPDLEYWRQCIIRMAQSSFLTGKTGKTPRVRGIDFLIEPGNHEKIMEGNYDDDIPQVTKPKKLYDDPEIKKEFEATDKARRELGLA